MTGTIAPMTAGAGPETGWSAPWSVQVGPGDQSVRLTVSGELDAATAADLTRHVSATTGGDIELDLRGVTFVDSSGLAALIEAHQRLARDQRRLRIVDDSEPVRRVLELSGVAPYLDLGRQV